MDIAILRDFFEVRVHFDWQLLAEAAAQGKVNVTPFVLYGYHQLCYLFHPWYEVHGRPAEWSSMGARQIRVSDLVANPDWVSASREDTIAIIAKRFRMRRDNGDAIPAQLTLLTYDVGEEYVGRECVRKHLVVDGSHRLAAVARLARQGWPFRFLVHSIKGPVDGKICPDLYYHGGCVIPAGLLKQPDQQ